MTDMIGAPPATQNADLAAEMQRQTIASEAAIELSRPRLKLGWLMLNISWGLMLIPVAGFILFGFPWFIAVVMAIMVLAQSNVAGGVKLLAAAMLGTPLVAALCLFIQFLFGAMLSKVFG